MLQEILSNKRIIIIFAVAVFSLAFLIVCFLRRNKRKKMLREIAEDKIREDTLDGIIQNSYQGKSHMRTASVPYEVDYSQVSQNAKSRAVADAGVHVTIQLIEYNELSVRKHMFNLDKSIRLGSALKGNTITVSGIEPYQCEIFEYQENVYIRDIAVLERTKIKRKRKSAYVDRNGTKLRAGDNILIGEIYIELKIIK